MIIMTDEQALRNFNSLEKEKLDPPENTDLYCFTCDCKIKIGEKYFEVDGYTYCMDCALDNFVRWND